MGRILNSPSAVGKIKKEMRQTENTLELPLSFGIRIDEGSKVKSARENQRKEGETRAGRELKIRSWRKTIRNLVEVEGEANFNSGAEKGGKKRGIRIV